MPSLHPCQPAAASNAARLQPAEPCTPSHRPPLQGTGDGAAVPDDDPLSGVGVGPLGDMPESLLNALNPDAFLAETSLPLPRLDGGMDDFLDSFLTSDKALEGGLGESL